MVLKVCEPDSPFARWGTLVCYFLIVASNNFQYINYAPVANEARNFFNMNALELNFLTTVYAITYPVFILAGCFVFHNFGLHPSIIAAASCNALGAVVKTVCVLVAPGFPMLLLSQVINGCSEVFYLSLPPLLSGTWFSHTQRTLSTAIAVMANPIGTALGFVVTPVVISTGDGVPRETHKREFFVFFLAQACAAVALIFLTFLLPKAPSVMPSVSAPQPVNSHSLWPVIKGMLKNPSFVLLSFAIGIASDMLWTVAAMLPQLLGPFGVSEKQCGWIGFCLTLSGAALGWAVGLYVDKKRRYKGPLVALLAGASLCFSAEILLLLYGSEEGPAKYLGSLVLLTIMGALLNALIPAQLELGVELTYPHPEAITTAFLVCLSGTLSPVLTIGATEIVGNNPDQRVVMIFLCTVACISTVATLVMLFVKDDKSALRRLLLEQQKDTESDESPMINSTTDYPTPDAAAVN